MDELAARKTELYRAYDEAALRILMDRYGGDMTCASSAYHQGQGTVDKWLRDPTISEDGLTLTSIPSDATKTYVQRILKYYEKYEKRYAEEA